MVVSLSTAQLKSVMVCPDCFGSYNCTLPKQTSVPQPQYTPTNVKPPIAIPSTPLVPVPTPQSGTKLTNPPKPTHKWYAPLDIVCVHGYVYYVRFTPYRFVHDYMANPKLLNRKTYSKKGYAVGAVKRMKERLFALYNDRAVFYVTPVDLGNGKKGYQIYYDTANLT